MKDECYSSVINLTKLGVKISDCCKNEDRNRCCDAMLSIIAFMYVEDGVEEQDSLNDVSKGFSYYYDHWKKSEGS